jgi:hypothetical protein
MLNLPAPRTSENPRDRGYRGITAPKSPYSPGSKPPRTPVAPRTNKGPRIELSRKGFTRIEKDSSV